MHSFQALYTEAAGRLLLKALPWQIATPPPPPPPRGPATGWPFDRRCPAAPCRQALEEAIVGLDAILAWTCIMIALVKSSSPFFEQHAKGP